MSAYDTSKPVMVTGATGYVAGWIIKSLLEEGFTVHAAVRDPSNGDKLKHLNALAAELPGAIRYFESDLLKIGSYAEAMEGCGVVFHTASPFTMEVKDPQKELVDPALLGTRNVLEQTNAVESVTRVVVTSSCAAVYGDNIDLRAVEGDRFTEADWNTSSSLTHQPYSYSKVLAEREAWKIAEAQDRWRLVTINPSLVVGPGINPFATSESFNIVKQLGDGTMKMGVPDFAIGAVDVRDVAAAHMAAGFKADAEGRHITSGHDASFLALADALRPKYGDTYPLPKGTTPKWMVWLLGPVFNKAITRKFVSRNVGHPWRADNRKSREALGVTYRPLEASMGEMFQQLIDNEIL